ncbi:hypothetical protein OG271_14490 [Micromonospora rifamycinica]|uniref:hypothetical protein n=1 Tax=Micromonospora rifamycinica TaxID=291594 RepID=UPI002E2D68AB|nr:hypothetical protein [Micromonospora rifamycinica]
MIRVAPTRPVWVSRLRDLTRLAVTALVLAVGLGGLFAATTDGPAAAAARPPVVTSRVAALPTDIRPGDDRPVDTRPGSGRPAPDPTRPLPAGSAAEPTVRPAARVDVATPDPLRDATGRRGPPRS